MIKQLNNLESSIDRDEYSQFSEFLDSVCGIKLGDNKQYLVSTRVRRILMENKFSSLSELTQRIQQGGDRSLRQQVIDAMTTNETFWFRDNYPFDYLAKTLLPLLCEQPNTLGKKIRIWTAACSSGQEPYSISMMAEESLTQPFSKKPRDIEVVATDLSSKILEAAKKGRYDNLALTRGLSKERASAFFSQIDSDTWGINNKIKARVNFRPLNLKDSFFLLGKFDIVFCRNVLIYFSTEFKKEILIKIHSTLAVDGMLFLGASESVSGLNDYYEMVHCNPGVAYRAKLLNR